MTLLNKIKKSKIFLNDINFKLIQGDASRIIDKLPEGSIDMIFADPPYFLSNDGVTCNSGKMVSVNKGDWDKGKNIDDIHNFNLKWIKACKEVLKEDGSIWISGTHHNIYSIGMALLENDYKILNNIVWEKKAPPPNLSCRYFTHSHETIIWARKNEDSKHIFNYDLMKEINKGKQMKDIWKIGRPLKEEKKLGDHPTQKPLELLMRIIQASTSKDMLILDPFNGSGTTGLAAIELKRKYIGIDYEKEYLNYTLKRYKRMKNQMRLL